MDCLSIKLVVVIIEEEAVYCAVRTDSLHCLRFSLDLRELNAGNIFMLGVHKSSVCQVAKAN